VSSSFVKDQKITIGFENWHGIPYILRAIDGSHVLIVYLNKIQNHIIVGKSLSILIQGITNAKFSFWDYDYGWVRTIHN